MKLSPVGRWIKLLTCAAVAAEWLGCGGLEDAAPIAPVVSSEATVCTMVSAGSPWWNQAFPQQSGRFHVELTATPSADDLDAVVGLSRDAAAQWASLAAIVRFNAEGLIDVRAGNEYRADAAYAYHAGVTYSIRFDIDLQAHTYSVWLKTSYEYRYTPIARDYHFRTEQAATAALDHVAGYLEPGRPGSLSICGVSVVQDDTAGDGCLRAAAGGGFANAQIDGTSGAMIEHFTARPSAAGIDAVVGFAKGAVDDYNDYAASIRFWTNGRIEARDGDTYRADVPVPYVADGVYDFQVVVDLPTTTYSVLVWNPGENTYIELARGYRFRTQQQAVTALDGVAAVVDSATGRVEVCEMRRTPPRALAFAREGAYGLLPLPGGGALISGEGRIQRLDAAGRTVAELAGGGAAAVDASGNVYVARADGGTLTLRSFTSALTPRWSRTYTAAGGVQAIGVFTTGEIAMAVGESRPAQLLQIAPGGAEHLRRDLTPYSAIAIGPCGYAVAYPIGDRIAIEVRGPDGALQWQRSWSGGFTIDQMVRDPSGNVIFAGTFTRTVDFGSGPFVPISTEDGLNINTYIVALAPDGALRFAERLSTTYPTGLASNGSRIVLATVFRTQRYYLELREFDLAGGQVWSLGEAEITGFAGSVAIGDNGRIYANLQPKLSSSALARPWPFLFAFDP
jgi:hypothetical protein